MKTWMIALLGLMLTTGLAAQGIEGVWETIDDASGKPKSHIRISARNGKYYGEVIKLLPAATKTVCDDCPGDKKGKPIVGLTVLEDLKPYKDYYSYGMILDPANGKSYKCSAWLNEKDVLEVRGYIGISLIGRTQKWYRVKED